MPDLRTLCIIAIWYGVASVVSLIVMWRDKRAAMSGTWRVRESTLHTLELLGGWPGTILGQRALRHKSRKRCYRIVLALIIAMHLIVWGLVLLQHWR